MYLSRMKLDTSRRSTMLALASPSKMHGAIESSFPGARERRLWRIDKLRGDTFLMLLSEEKPDLSSVHSQFGSVHEAPLWETKDYDPLLDRIENDSVWRFRLVACPVKSVCSSDPGGKSRGKISSLTADQQKEWLLSRAEKNGFSLAADDFDVVHREVKHFIKGKDKGNEVTISSAAFEGVLTVKDKDAFCNLLQQGMGRGKAYGLGMMTVVRCG